MKTLLCAFAALAAMLASGVVLGDDAFERAHSLAIEKRYEEAREVLDPLLERLPGHPRARLLHGVLRVREGRIAEAVDVFEGLRRDHPDMVEPYNNLAVLHAVEGRLEDARAILLAALERRPDATVYANLADVYGKLARRAYERARELETGGGAHRELGAAAMLPATPEGAARTGAPDAGTASAGASDAGASTAGTADAGTADAGTAPDAGAPDAGTAQRTATMASGDVATPSTGVAAAASSGSGSDAGSDSVSDSDAGSDSGAAAAVMAGERTDGGSAAATSMSDARTDGGSAPTTSMSSARMDGEPAPTASTTGTRMDGESAPTTPAPPRQIAAGSPDAEPASSGAGSAAAVAAAGQAPDAEPRDAGEGAAGTLPASTRAASTVDAFCAHTGGFQGRRDVAEAALWLQSYGAEVLEVRHEERRVAGSYRVYLPPFETRDAALAMLREIRGQGVRDVALIGDGELTNGISFGIFRDADNMHRRVAALDRLGYTVRSQESDVEVVKEYVIKARAGGTPDALDAAWAAQFPEHSLWVVHCG